MTNIRRWTSVLLLAVSFLAGGRTAWAQATFSVSSAATTVIRTGHAEPVGELTFSVISGTTRPGIIAIDLSPAVLTSAPAIISTRGFPLTDFSATVDPETGRVELHVPSGMGPGTSVNVEGLRVSVHESGIETLDARISTVENRLTSDNRVIRVIAGAADAIVVDPSTDSVYTYSSGRVLVDPLGHFTFSEGFAGAFSDDTDAGRTAPTEIIFQASSLPRNTQLRFPATIRSQTRATLTTVGEEDVTLVSGASRNQVVYTFSSSASRRTVVDVFSVRPVLERTGPVGHRDRFLPGHGRANRRGRAHPQVALDRRAPLRGAPAAGAAGPAGVEDVPVSGGGGASTRNRSRYRTRPMAEHS